MSMSTCTPSDDFLIILNLVWWIGRRKFLPFWLYVSIHLPCQCYVISNRAVSYTEICRQLAEERAE